MHNVIQDLRFAARSFRRSPRFAVPAILALALGIGATSAIFSVVRGVMLRPLPYSDPERIVVVWESNARQNRNVIANANFVEWRERNRSFTHLAMAGPARISVMLGGQPEEIVGRVASSDLFPILGVQPALGRAYGPAEDEEGRDNVIVVSDEFWRTRLGGRPDVIGTTIRANGRSRTLIGVMPAGFTLLGERTDFLIPYGWTIEGLRATRGRGSSFGIARLREDMSFEQASLDMKGLAAQLSSEAPQRNAGWSVTLVPVHEQMVDQIRPRFAGPCGRGAVRPARLVRQRRQSAARAQHAPRARDGRAYRPWCRARPPDPPTPRRKSVACRHRRRRRSRPRVRVSSRTACAGRGPDSGSAAEPGKPRPDGRGTHDGTLTCHRPRVRTGSRDRVSALDQRLVSRRWTTRQRPESPARARNTGSRRSGAVPRPSYWRRPARPQLRPIEQHQSRISCRRTSHDACAASTLALRHIRASCRASRPLPWRASGSFQVYSVPLAWRSCRLLAEASEPVFTGPINRRLDRARRPPPT